MEKGGRNCPTRTVKEETLQEVVSEAVNKLLGGKETCLPVLQANFESAIGDTSGAAINEKLAEFQKERLITKKIHI